MAHKSTREKPKITKKHSKLTITTTIDDIKSQQNEGQTADKMNLEYICHLLECEIEIMHNSTTSDDNFVSSDYENDENDDDEEYFPPTTKSSRKSAPTSKIKHKISNKSEKKNYTKKILKMTKWKSPISVCSADNISDVVNARFRGPENIYEANRNKEYNAPWNEWKGVKNCPIMMDHYKFGMYAYLRILSECLTTCTNFTTLTNYSDTSGYNKLHKLQKSKKIGVDISTYKYVKQTIKYMKKTKLVQQQILYPGIPSVKGYIPEMIPVKKNYLQFRASVPNVNALQYYIPKTDLFICNVGLIYEAHRLMAEIGYDPAMYEVVYITVAACPPFKSLAHLDTLAEGSTIACILFQKTEGIRYFFSHKTAGINIPNIKIGEGYSISVQHWGRGTHKYNIKAEECKNETNNGLQTGVIRFMVGVLPRDKSLQSILMKNSNIFYNDDGTVKFAFTKEQTEELRSYTEKESISQIRSISMRARHQKKRGKKKKVHDKLKKAREAKRQKEEIAEMERKMQLLNDDNENEETKKKKAKKEEMQKQIQFLIDNDEDEDTDTIMIE